MKKVLFCIVCLNMALLCFGQPVKIKLVAEREAFVVFGNERYDLKREKPVGLRWRERICTGKGCWQTRSVFCFRGRGFLGSRFA